MGKKKGKGKKKKAKEPSKDPKITIAEYLLDCGTQKKLRLMENAKEWEDENRELKTQVGGQRSELDATIAFLRRQEGSERRACDEDVAARDGEIGEAEAQLRAEQRRHERAEFELSEELREVMMEATDKQEQVDFWKNYPFNQNLEKREKIKCLKLGIQQIDQLHDAFETQLDGNFRYMQNYLVSGHVRRLERAKRSAAARALRHVSLSDHSDLVAQAALCLQSVINHQHGDTLRDHMDWIEGQNSSLKHSLAPLRRLDPPAVASAPSGSDCSIFRTEPAPAPSDDGGPLRLRVEGITHLLTAARPSSAERALIDHVRDTTLERLRPDEDEQRARALAKLVRPAASEHGGSDDSLSHSGSESDVSRLSDDQLLPFESPIQVPASVRRQALRPFEEWSRQRHWWRVQAPRPRTRRWPVTGPHLALYADQPPVFDLSGPKVINESPSVSSAHISDDWELGKVGWQEHLRRRSVISADSAGAGLDAPPAAGRAHSGALDARAGSSRAATGRAGGTAPPAARTGRGSATGRPSGSSLAKSSSRSEVKTNASKQSITSASSSKSVTTKASSKATLKTV
ncbi:uncharacterized protein LOC122383808 isoform X2 [Amphibalanus amphitrite]|uniref:uncharacterized protein LOC122383808 isoform X2 n=1 Tax=Amphibalanus amphitrite TaxID=1232801 RepID=UPI001C911464|nr:uncharacterized protein LOC122383808 isoform X2 [Amphibalanus amphitrite]